jgi:penicillin-binding protein 2
MFGWFDNETDSDLFVLQEGNGLGHVNNSDAPPVIGDSMEGKSPSDAVEKKQFLGLTIPDKRFKIAAVFLCSLFLLLVGRAAHLQIVSGDHYTSLAEQNRFREYTIVPPRGKIYDHNGKALAENTPSFTLMVIPGDLPEETTERNEVLSKAASLAGTNRADIDLLLTRYADVPHRNIPVKRNIPHESAMRIALSTADLPGFNLQADATRHYLASTPSLSHVLGYMGKINENELEEFGTDNYRRVDMIGKAGVERSAEETLRGTVGRRVVEVNAQGQELSVVSKEDPIPGKDIQLGIDADLQKFIEVKTQEVLEDVEASKAAVVAIDPRDGSVRALVSMPGYDNNGFARGIDQEYYQRLLEDDNNPMFPRAVAGEYPSGSTFKPFVAYAALSEGLVDAHSSFVSTGGVRIGQWFFPDWKAGGHGVTDVRKAIAESVNTYFYIIGGGYNDFTGLGVKRIREYAEKFGFGSKMGVDLPSEAPGFLPSKDWKQEAKGERWYVGDTYNLAIGQGDVLVSPLQMATATAKVANGGKDITPRVVEDIDGEPTPPQSAPDIEDLDKRAMQIVREGMRRTVTVGSARYLQTVPTPVAGKTGTAQTPGDKPTHAWFTGFGPYEDPNITLAVLVENGGGGSEVAVPLARDIFNWWFENNQNKNE